MYSHMENELTRVKEVYQLTIRDAEATEAAGIFAPALTKVGVVGAKGAFRVFNKVPLWNDKILIQSVI